MLNIIPDKTIWKAAKKSDPDWVCPQGDPKQSDYPVGLEYDEHAEHWTWCHVDPETDKPVKK